MTVKTLQLSLGSNLLDFDDWPTHGIIVGSVDLGFPDLREVLTDLPGVDGVYDETAFFGARTITLTGNMGPCADGSRSQGLLLLGPFVVAGARPQLIVALDDDMPPRAFTGRVTNFTGPVANGSSVDFTASWKCADPIAYSLTTSEVDIIPASADSDDGRSYPLTYPRTYPASYGGNGKGLVTTNGNYSAWPVLKMFGPVVDPVVTWLDPVSDEPLGIQVVFAGISIADGDYLEVDTKAQTALLNGDPGANRYSFIDFAATNWGPLQSGANLLLFTASSAETPSVLNVLWQDAFLL